MNNFTPPNPKFKDYVEEKLERQFFMKHVGLEIISIEPGAVVAKLELQKIHEQQNGFTHGGVLTTAADLVMGFAAYTLCREGKGVVTAELNMQFFRPGIGHTLMAYGKVNKAGNALFFCEADLFVINARNESTFTNKATSAMAVIDILKQ